MNYNTMTCKQLTQALTRYQVKGRSKATTKAQKIKLLKEYYSDLHHKKMHNRTKAQKHAEAKLRWTHSYTPAVVKRIEKFVSLDNW